MTECARCGGCCRSDMIAYVTPEDRERWVREGRSDILDSLEQGQRLWAGDRIVYSSGRGPVSSCTFLRWQDNESYCAIYETRPRVCRDFTPGESLLCPASG